jgi:AraC family transcriptional activator of pobA
MRPTGSDNNGQFRQKIALIDHNRLRLTPMLPTPTYRLYGEKTAETPGFWVHCETIRVRSSRYRWEIRPHKHDDFFQILYLETGPCTALLGALETTVTPPALLTVPPRVRHGFRFAEETQGLVITLLKSHLSAAPDRLSESLSAPQSLPLPPNSPDAAYLVETLRRLSAEFAERRPNRDALMAAYTALLLQLTARLCHERAAPPNRGEDRLDQLTGLIHRHFRDHRPVSFYAAELGLSLTHLNRVIKAVTGLAPSDLIAAKLLEEAKRDLIFSRAPIQEISYRLGFSDPAYFSRFFVKQTGQPPLMWRRDQQARMEGSAKPQETAEAL